MSLQGQDHEQEDVPASTYHALMPASSMAFTMATTTSTAADTSIPSFISRRRPRRIRQDFTSGCDRCKSDLNIKLLIKCALCSFHRHLYCFTPPLKQHPVLATLGTKAGSLSRTSLDWKLSQWRCDECTKSMGPPPPEPMMDDIEEDIVLTRKKKKSISPKSKKTTKKTKSQQDTGLPIEKARHISFKDQWPIQPPQQLRPPSPTKNPLSSPPPPAVAATTTTATTDPPPFDWVRFREAKLQRLLVQVQRETLTSITSGHHHNTSSLDTLVFYSKSYVLMKKTASFWIKYVDNIKKKKIQKQLNQQQEVDTATTTLEETSSSSVITHDINRSVLMHPTTETLRERMEGRLMLQEEEHMHEVLLYDDSRLFQNILPKTNGQLLNTKTRKKSSISMSNSQCKTSVLAYRRRISSMVNSRRGTGVSTFDFLLDENMIAEDSLSNEVKEEEQPPPLPEVLVVGSPIDPEWTDESYVFVEENAASFMGLELAVRLIQRHFRWYRTAKNLLMIKREAKRRRRLVATKNWTICYCYYVRMSIWMKQTLILIQKKKVQQLLIQNLQDAAQDQKIKTDDQNDLLAKKRALSQVRIQRFFLRKVRIVIKNKKQMMARRIQVAFKRYQIIYLKWYPLIPKYCFFIKKEAAKKIQHTYKRYITHIKYVQLVEKNAIRKLQRLIRGWLMERVTKKEKTRFQIWTLTKSILDEHHYDYQKEEEEDELVKTISKILLTLGMSFYEQGEYWESASIFERMLKKMSLKEQTFKLTRPTRIALAYSHHITWYTSYDLYNLHQAKEHYTNAIQPFVKSKRVNRKNTKMRQQILKREDESDSDDSDSEKWTKKTTTQLTDPYVLLDFATVLMQLSEYKRSLLILGKIIEYFSPEFEHLGMCLLFAGLQLQQIGLYEQSLEYLNLLQDVPPFPYKEYDMMILCAFAYEKMGQKKAFQEGLKSALRLWTLEQKQTSMLKHTSTQMSMSSIQLMTTGSTINSSTKTSSTKSSGTSLKRILEMIFDLATRSCQQGHFLLSAMCYLYGLRYLNPKDQKEDDKKNLMFPVDFAARQWLGLADVMRHLGMLSLCQDAVNSAYELNPNDPKVQQAYENWKQPVHVFTKELNELTDVMKLQQLVQKQEDAYKVTSILSTEDHSLLTTTTQINTERLSTTSGLVSTNEQQQQPTDQVDNTDSYYYYPNEEYTSYENGTQDPQQTGYTEYTTATDPSAYYNYNNSNYDYDYQYSSYQQ